jgi:MFS family permease
LTFAAIPGLVVGAVPKRETGSAMGFYQVVRYVGFSLGSALTASILASRTPSGQHLPTESGYPLVLWAGVAICLLAAALAWFLPAREGPRKQTDVERLSEEDAELAGAGLVGPSVE